MALGNEVLVDPLAKGSAMVDGGSGMPNSASNRVREAGLVVPVSAESDWVTVIDSVKTADNGGGTIVDPVTEIDGTDRHQFDPGGRFTQLLVRMAYTTAGTGIVDPVVQLFGLDSTNEPLRLTDSDGNHELTLAVDATNDVRDGTLSYTEAKTVDLQGCIKMLAGVKTLASGTGLTVAKLEVKPL